MMGAKSPPIDLRVTANRSYQTDRRNAGSTAAQKLHESFEDGSRNRSFAYSCLRLVIGPCGTNSGCKSRKCSTGQYVAHATCMGDSTVSLLTAAIYCSDPVSSILANAPDRFVAHQTCFHVDIWSIMPPWGSAGTAWWFRTPGQRLIGCAHILLQHRA